MTTPPPVHSPKPVSRTGLYIGIGAAVFVGFLMVVGVIIGAVAIASKRVRDKEAMANFQQETQRIKNDLQADADLSDPANAKKADEAVDRMAAAAGSVDERMKIMVKTVMEEMVAIGKEASNSTNRLVSAGGIDPATLTSREAATKRLEVLEKERVIADANLKRARNLNQTARDAASKAGLSKKETESFIAGMNGQGKLERVIRIREIDAILYPQFIKFVTLLRDNHGSWKVEDGEVVFADVAAGITDRFNDLSKSIADLSEEQTTLVEQVSSGN